MIPANKRKTDWLRDGLFNDYADAANTLAVELEKQWLVFFRTQAKKDRPQKLLPSVKPEHKLKYTTTVVQQAYTNSVFPAFVSKIGNVVNDIRSDINRVRTEQDIDVEILKSLYYINKSRKWLVPEELTIEWSDWLKERFYFHWNRRSVPVFKNNVICLDQRNCKIQQSKSVHFESWMRVTHNRDGVTVPVKTNPYADKHTGIKKGMFRIRYNETEHRLETDVVKSVDYGDSISDYIKLCDSLDKTIGLDFGLRNVFVSSNGNKYGVNLIDYMTKLDKRIQHIQSQCQKRNFSLSRSKRYRKLIHKFRSTVDRSINETLNLIVEVEHPSILVVERLDFRSPELSRRMNRLISNCGRAAVAAKLSSLEEQFGIEHIEVNPAYSSQTCNKCGYVDKRNRVNRDIFECRYCSHKDCADTNAAMNIVKRRSWKKWWLNAHRKAVLNKLVTEFIQSHNGVLAGTTKQVEMIRLNPYFKQHLNAEVVPGKVGVGNIEKCFQP